ncbi:HD-GYP domain-containing protein [Paenibacillus sp. GYB003]|uniref:HD-GYP domain-containing protein n=1 Tax=Paenibacillus sp. GYB003 TaxID=2994392 RepID=UPI002F96A3DB
MGYTGELSLDRPIGIQIEEAIAVMKSMFEHVRISKQIPLAELRTRVVPIIRLSVERLHLFQLFALLPSKQDYLHRHSFAVGALSMLIGKWLRMPEQELLQLTTAALLHNVGKTQIPAELLGKPDKLTEDEYETVKRHTVLGFELIRRTVGATHRQAIVALQHHERNDGSGYPFGLKGDRLDPFSRIVAAADVFHAMLSDKAYRSPSPLYEVLRQMEDDSYGTLDPNVVAALIGKSMQALIGCEVTLTDGTPAKIVLVQPHRLTRPLVQAEIGFIDLSQDYSIHIHRVRAVPNETIAARETDDA